MEFNDFELICRICLQQDEKMISIFDKVLNFHPKTYSEILVECASANISADDLLPKNICIQCSTYTEQSYKLRTQCLESEKILHRAIENLRIKEEHTFHNEIDIDDNFCINEENVCKIEEVEEDLLNEEQVETTITKVLNKDEIDNYQCENCSGRFSCVLELHIHTKNIHLDSTIQCPFCKKMFTNTHPLKVHCKEFNRCNICGEKCGCRNNLIKHRKIHQTCEICGKKFGNLTKCINHKMVHSGEKPHLCPHCGKAFADYKNLQDHIRIHTGEKPFQCTLCDAKFRVSFGLKAHLTSHSNERKYSCEICNASYKRKSALNEHMKTHNNLIYQCNVCDKQLQTSDGLRGHRKIHTDEPKHVCTYCDKRFLEKYNLRTHMRTHTGEKPFACDLCGKKFTHKQSIYTHQKYCRKKLKSNIEQSKSHRNLEKKIEIE